MERLTNDLYLFSKLDIKQLPFTFENINIMKYLDDAIEELNFTLNEDNIVLNYESHYESNDLIVADRQRLVRVIHNIIENAKKHLNKQKKEIKIVLKEEKTGALIEITDNGCGIPADKLTLIFDRFFRVDCARNRATGGSGIGLSIAKEIIEAHKGIIWAESTEGLGTSIFFTLKKVAYFKIN
jgi:signal transduction histidine kinase